MVNRILLFLLTNLAILLVLSVVMKFFGLENLMANTFGGTGINLTGLLIFSAAFGFGGSFISLFISKWMAKRATGAKVIESPSSEEERWLVNTTRQLSERAGIGMPEVAIFNSAAPNAFATGANRNKSLVAVSTGLLRGMKREQVKAVLGHEIGHIANGDMITLTLIQGVLNTFVIFLSRIIGMIVDRFVLRNERGMGIGYWVTTIIAQILLGILASAVVMWFSRRREFRADAAGAQLAGRNNMINALEALRRSQGAASMPESLAAFGISPSARSGMARLFASHPPLDERIRALKSSTL